jgi:hypothetical protein
VRRFDGDGGCHAEPVQKTKREAESLQSLARVLRAARLGEALVLRAARSCRMDDLEQAGRR